MAFNAGTSNAPPEMMTFDEQVVACEVEIDTFDVEEYGDSIGEESGTVQEDYGIEGQEVGTSGYDYQYEEDPNHVYLFDEDTSEIHKLDRTRNEEIVDYYKESIPSTSDRMPSTSSAPGFRNSEMPPNTYYIRKGTHRANGARIPVYSQMSFQTTYSQSINRRGKRVLKRTHVPMTTEDMESMMEDSQVMRRIQQEITVLKKSNDLMKKTFEETHRRFESMNMVLAEAKIKQKQAIEEKRQLQRELTVARTTNTQLSRKVQPPNGVYRFAPHHHHHHQHN